MDNGCTQKKWGIQVNTKRLATMALLCAIALTIFLAEAQIPMPITGVKPGLSNIVTLFTIALLGKREAWLVLTARIVLGSVFAGSASSLIFSMTGGMCAYVIMSLTINIFPENLLWAVSVFGAIAHNTGQLTAAALITRTPEIFIYWPVLLVSAIITGAFTGFAAQYLVKSGLFEKFDNN